MRAVVNSVFKRHFNLPHSAIFARSCSFARSLLRSCSFACCVTFSPAVQVCYAPRNVCRQAQQGLVPEQLRAAAAAAAPAATAKLPVSCSRRSRCCFTSCGRRVGGGDLNGPLRHGPEIPDIYACVHVCMFK